MTLRATGQNVEVLADGSGKIRATRQMVNVLVDGAGKARVTGQCIEVLVNEPTGSEVNETVSQSLSFSQTATQGAAKAGVASDTLAFTQEATASASNNISQAISFADEATAVVDKRRSVSQSLGLIQSVEIRGPVYVTVHHALNLEQSDVGHAGVVNLGVEDDLNLTDLASRVVPVSVSQSLSFTQSGVRKFTGIGSNTLSFSQAVRYGKSKGVHDVLGLAQTVQTAGTFNRPVSQSLGIEQACTYIVEGANRLDRRYNPLVGDGPTSPEPPPTSLDPPLEGITDPFKLVYPSTGAVTDSCVLRAPNLGNRDRLSFNRINRETRGGTLVVFADPDWPKTQTLVLSFSALTKAEGQDLLQFLTDHLGQEIGIIDWEKRYWRGIVTTTTDPVVEDSRGSFSAQFEFEGELDPTGTP